MTSPETPYEAASYDLNKFRERRLAERRLSSRNSMDRRMPQVMSEGALPHDRQIFGNSKVEVK